MTVKMWINYMEFKILTIYPYGHDQWFTQIKIAKCSIMANKEIS